MEDKAARAMTPVTRYESKLEEAQRELDHINGRLEVLEQERRALEEERQDLERRGAHVAGKIEVLESLCSEIEDEEEKEKETEWAELVKLGIQECCYRVLVESGKRMEAWEIKNHLEQHGVDMKDRYINPVAVIHTSLKRIPDRVRSTRQKGRVGSDGTRTAWIRSYEAIKPGAETPPKK